MLQGAGISGDAGQQGSGQQVRVGHTYGSLAGKDLDVRNSQVLTASLCTLSASAAKLLGFFLLRAALGLVSAATEAWLYR